MKAPLSASLSIFLYAWKCMLWHLLFLWALFLWFLFSKITCVIFQLQKYSPSRTCKRVAMKFKPISMHTRYRLNTMAEAGRVQIPTQFFSSCSGTYHISLILSTPKDFCAFSLILYCTLRLDIKWISYH